MGIIDEIIEYLKDQKIDVISFEQGYYSNYVEYPAVLSLKVLNEDVIKWEYFLKRYNEKSVKATSSYVEGVFKIIFGATPRPELIGALEHDLYLFKKSLEKKYFKVCPTESGISLIVKATHRCRYNCKYCSDKKNRETIHGDMTFEVVEKMLDLLSQHSRRATWLWHGGEPTEVSLDWYKHVHEHIVPKYPMLELSFQVMSNGSNYNDEWLSFLEKHNISPGMSYDVFSHSEQRNSDYKMKKMEETIKLVQKYKVAFGTITVITRKNYKQMIEMYEHLKTINLNTCFNLFFRTGTPYDDEFDIDDIDDYVKEFLKYFKYWLYDKNGRHERSAVEALSKVIGGTPSCCLSTDCRNKWLCVHPTGELYPCDKALDKSYSLGYVNDYSSINEIFLSNKYNKYIAEVEHKFQTHCKGCGIFNVCNGGCNAVYMQNKTESSLMQKNYCEITKKVYIGVYEILRELDVVHNSNINPTARKILYNNSFYSICDIKMFMERKDIEFDLNYEQEDLFECSEYQIFRGVNPVKVGCGTHIHSDVYDDYSDEFIMYNEEQRFNDLDKYLRKVAELCL